MIEIDQINHVIRRRQFALRLRYALRSRGQNQQWLADSTLLSESYISRLVSGHRSPSTDTLARLARVLRVQVETLWRDEI
jgi:transcriptional regulator with XRE-family HTH domain